jgi:plasmid stabilization system protein ParE
MPRRYILAPEAALDLVEIWRYLKNKGNVEIADRVERAIRDLRRNRCG